MQSRQTPKWLELFITAFGANGLVALAWWMGALHADRIRSAQRSYPFLEVTGAAGCGKSALLSVLWRLIGNDQPTHLSTECSSRMSVLRTINQPVNWPVVLEEVDQEEGDLAEPFDWDQLKTLYNGDSPIRAVPGRDDHKFRGALVILGNPPLSEAMRSRFVIIELDHSQRTEAGAQALRELLDMHSTGGIDFYDTVQAAGERLEGLLQHTTAYFVQPHDNKRAAFNHAQLHALLGVLDDLFVLPTEAREDAHIEVAAMALITD